MCIIFQINVVANSGSTGRIAEELGSLVIRKGWKSYIAYGQYANKSQSTLIRIGNKVGIYFHGLLTRLFDMHGLGSVLATKKLIKQIERIKPDVIHLHNIHGYYINYKILFSYLSNSNIPVVWTLHDCWAYTGHCAYYTYAKCNRWQSQCYSCPIKRSYPASFLFDRSKDNFLKKKKYFTTLSNLSIITVSQWLKREATQSFLKVNPIRTIYNGIDTDVFRPSKTDKQVYGIQDKFVILGIANVWSDRKGLNDFIRLSSMLAEDEIIILVGLSDEQIKNLPSNIIGITRLESTSKLAELYSLSDILFNPSVEETFGLTTVESMACGTPVIVYNSTASPEIVSPDTGFVVKSYDIENVRKAIDIVKKQGKTTYAKACRERVLAFFDKHKMCSDYLALYTSLIKNKKIKT